MSVSMILILIHYFSLLQINLKIKNLVVLSRMKKFLTQINITKFDNKLLLITRRLVKIPTLINSMYRHPSKNSSKNTVQLNLVLGLMLRYQLLEEFMPNASRVQSWSFTIYVVKVSKFKLWLIKERQNKILDIFMEN